MIRIIKWEFWKIWIAIMSLNIIPPSLRTDSGSLAGETVPAADQSCHVS